MLSWKAHMVMITEHTEKNLNIKFSHDLLNFCNQDS